MTTTRRIGERYSLVRKIAAGGMGELYLATMSGPHGFEKQVVVKRILLGDADREAARELVEMFLDEARTLAGIRHPNVVDVYEVGQDENGWFLAMEFLDGSDVRRILTESKAARLPVPLGQALQIIIDAAQGLHHAHEQTDSAGKPLGIVHRDISPGNLVVTRQGVTKVVDFGIAQAANRMRETTERGVVRGKLQYMSPEQICGEPLDRRSDLFSLGLVLYEITTTRPAFESTGNVKETALDVAHAKIPRPTSVVADYPRALEKIVMHALAARKADRFRGCDELASALEEFLEASGISHSPRRVAAYLRTLFGEAAPEPAKKTELPATKQVGVPEKEASEPAPVETSTDENALLDALKSVLHGDAVSRKNNLPRLAEFFVGREADIAAVHGLLERNALVTIRGAGGVGKTQLALQVATSETKNFPGGVWFVDLTEARGPHSIAAAVGAALGALSDDAVRVGRALAARGRALVVLDNFEHLVDQGASTVGEWLRSARETVFLASSREALGLPGEATWMLEPLAPPREGQPAEESPAVQLLLRRIRQLRPRWQATPEDLAAIVKIAVALEGLPLALELAAGRLGVLSPASFLEMLPTRRDLLRAPRTGSRRQAALDDTIAWSWEMLEPAERSALAQASVFRGGFDLAAAEAVLSLDGGWTLDVLQALEQRSLLRTWEPEEHPGEVRFGTFVHVREFAAAQLASAGGVESAFERHALYYVKLGLEAAAAVDGHGGIANRRRIALEQENLRAVVERGAKQGGPAWAERALAAVLALDPVLATNGPAGLHLELLDLALEAAAREKLEGAALTTALLRRGRARRVRGKLPEALADLGAALRLANAAGDKGLAADVLMQLGFVELTRGHAAEARTHEEEALELAEVIGDRRRIATAEGFLASMPHAASERETVSAHFSRALSLHRELGNSRLEGTVLANFGVFLRRSGRLEEAKSCAERALAIYREIGDRALEGAAIGNLAGLHLERNTLEEAAELYPRAIALVREAGDRGTEAIFRMNSGILEHLRDRFADADAHFAAAQAAFDELKDRRLGGFVRALRAALAADRGETREAVDAMAEARDRLSGDESLLMRAVDVLAGVVALALSRERTGAPDPVAARQSIELARRPDASGVSPAESSEDVRLALRVLERALAR